MKKILLVCILYFVAISAYAETCPPGPEAGYEFVIAAWGNHSKERDVVRCHYYYYSDYDRHIEVDTYTSYEENAFKYHRGWDVSDHYALCNAYATKNVNDCPFGGP
jgi:hypothetical protein